MNPAVLFALGAMLCWGIGDFLIQRGTRKVGNVEALAWIGLFGSIFLFPLVYKDFSLLFTLGNLIFLLVLGVIVFISAIINFEALKEGKISIIDILLQIELPVTVILSVFFLKEKITLYQIFLAAMILVGTFLISAKKVENWKINLEKGTILALIAGILLGAINFMTASASKTITPAFAIWFPWLIFTILCFIVIGAREGFVKFLHNGIKYKTILFWMALFDTLAWLLYAYALQNEKASIITAITESYPVIAVILGIWINKEKNTIRQFAGIVLAIIASFLLILTI